MFRYQELPFIVPVFHYVVLVPFNRETPACLMGKVSQLESMVKALQEDLKKVCCATDL